VTLIGDAILVIVVLFIVVDVIRRRRTKTAPAPPTPFVMRLRPFRIAFWTFWVMLFGSFLIAQGSFDGERTIFIAGIAIDVGAVVFLIFAFRHAIRSIGAFFR